MDLFFEADNERIDIARSEFRSGQSLKIVQYTTSLPKGFEMNYEADSSMALKPYDHVYVRTIPEYEMQRTVRVDGEVKYPGTYPLIEDRERIYDIIMRLED